MSCAAEYTLRAVVHLARTDSPVIAAEIARKERMPPTYTAKLLQDLARHGILLSRKGANGGFSLLRHPSEITVFELLQVVEPARIPPYYPEPLRNAMLRYLRETTIADLLKQERRKAGAV